MDRIKLFQIEGKYDIYGKVEDYLIGYEIDYFLCKIPKKEAKRLFKNPEIDICKVKNFEKIEPYLSYESIYLTKDISNKINPSYYWIIGMDKAQLYNSDKEFFDTFSKENTLLFKKIKDFETNKEELVCVGNMSTAIELEFIGEMGYIEYYKDERGKVYKFRSEKEKTKKEEFYQLVIEKSPVLSDDCYRFLLEKTEAYDAINKPFVLYKLIERGNDDNNTPA